MKESDQFAAMIAGLVDTGVSHTEIAQVIGRSRQTVWRIVHGHIREPGGTASLRLKNFAESRAVAHMQPKSG